MLELAILGLLKDSELHGYELKRRLQELLGPWSSVSFGSLYPALNRLEAAGAVKAVEAEDRVVPPVPMTGSLGGELAAFRARRTATARGGRTKKVYGITTRGEALFEELLAPGGGGDDERSFTLRLSFARYLTPDARLRLLERRRALLVERLAKAREAFRGSGERLDTYARSLVEHGAEATERDITWLESLITAERAASTDSTTNITSTKGIT